MNCSTFRTHWVNYTDLSPESADLPRQCTLPENPVLSIQMLEDRYALENHLLDAVNHGDAELAMQALQSFRGVTIPGRKGHTKTTTVRFRAVALNALLRKEAERAEVHAFYLDTLYNDYLLAAPWPNPLAATVPALPPPAAPALLTALAPQRQCGLPPQA